ncbi:MAG: hypothetical protein NW214_08605 [Pseudanabaenaceae cyanobacterium bins.39]|nr:hypothetical protein [Pseudanabaenaceae cyanobacterium bins.39]
MQQLDIFSLPLTNPSGELPVAVVAPKNEAIKVDADLTVGCHVRSDLFFKGKIGKVIALQKVHTFVMATVRIDLNGNLIDFPCATSKLEVINV